MMNMKYAVVNINGSQCKVAEGDKLTVSKLPFEEGKTQEFPEVLLLSDNGKIKIGKPFLKDVLVKVKITKHLLGEKLDIFKFKAKTGYRKKQGFRPRLTNLEIIEIKG